MRFMVKSLKPFTFLADYSRIWSSWGIYVCMYLSIHDLRFLQIN